MNFLKIPNKKGDKIIFYYDFGRGRGQRPSTGIFIYKNPKDLLERNHNKESLALIKLKESQLIIENQAVGAIISSQIILLHFKLTVMQHYAE